jgi:hypothetical protein
MAVQVLDLGGFGLVRVMTTSPHQSAYGDAFYIKPPAARRD